MFALKTCHYCYIIINGLCIDDVNGTNETCVFNNRGITNPHLPTKKGLKNCYSQNINIYTVGSVYFKSRIAIIIIVLYVFIYFFVLILHQQQRLYLLQSFVNRWGGAVSLLLSSSLIVFYNIIRENRWKTVRTTL